MYTRKMTADGEGSVTTAVSENQVERIARYRELSSRALNRPQERTQASHVQRLEDVRRAMAREPWIAFLLDRVYEEAGAIRGSNLSPGDSIPLMRRVQSTEKTVSDYVEAFAQSYGDRATLWGREARLGLYTALRNDLMRYKDHPDFQENW